MILEPQQSGAETAQQRLQVPLLLSSVVQQPLTVDEQERNIRAEQILERVDSVEGIVDLHPQQPTELRIECGR